MKKGFVLVVSIIILASITVIAASFVSMMSARTRAAAGRLDNSRALWAAEAGIQQVVYKLKTDATYRNSPSTVSGSVGTAAYTVTVTKRANQTIYDISSQGTSGVMSRTISQTLTAVVGGWVKQFTDYASFAGGTGGITLKATSTITGDAYTTKTVSTDATSSVSGTVYAPSGTGNYTRQPLPVPPLAMPAFTSSYYDSMINTAKTYTKKDMTYATLNLAGSTVYVNGKVTATNITGPGTIVCVNDFVTNGGSITNGVTVISGANITTTNNSSFGTNTVLYAATSVQSSSNNVSMQITAIITPGTVSVTKLTFIGAIYALGNITLDQNTTVTGAVVTGGTLSLNRTSRASRDTGQLPANVPAGLERGGSSTTVTFSDWSG